jgi:hypothetical protein
VLALATSAIGVLYKYRDDIAKTGWAAVAQLDGYVDYRIDEKLSKLEIDRIDCKWPKEGEGERIDNPTHLPIIWTEKYCNGLPDTKYFGIFLSTDATNGVANWYWDADQPRLVLNVNTLEKGKDGLYPAFSVKVVFLKAKIKKASS